MRRSFTRPDPLLLLILSSLGAAGACGGESRSGGTPEEPSGATGGATTGGTGVTTGGTGVTTGGTGVTTGGAGVTTGGVGGGGAPPVMEGVAGCSNPSYPFGEDSGLVGCNGFYRRAEAGRCPQTPIRPGEPSAAALPLCVTDADCAHLDNGRCYGGGPTTPSCVSSCETDQDCEAGELCFCDATVNRCVPSNCRSDADCGSGLLCASYWEALQACQSSIGFACQVEGDECTRECPAGQSCEIRRSGDEITRACISHSGTGGTCGRPFLVSGSERLAHSLLRDDWCNRSIDEALWALDELTHAERLALAAHWEAAALMEHASIAAFARFTLELLALGAPAKLVEDACAAMADEQRHATACFSLASAFAGTRLGPGPLPVGDCLARVELEHVTVTTFLEGCIGETLAAVEARELAHSVENPVLRQTLAGIAEDEARHALLAWSFVNWAVERGGPDLVVALREALCSAISRPLEARDDSLLPERQLALGLPPKAFRVDLRRRVLEEIVTPCLDAISTSLNRPCLASSRPTPSSTSNV